MTEQDEIIEQISHLIATSGINKEFAEKIIETIKISTKDKSDEFIKDYNFHKKEKEKHYKRWIDGEKISKNQYKKHLRHLFIEEYLESKIKETSYSDLQRIFNKYYMETLSTPLVSALIMGEDDDGR